MLLQQIKEICQQDKMGVENYRKVLVVIAITGVFKKKIKS